RDDAMRPLSIVGDQDQSCGVHIEPAYRMQPIPFIDIEQAHDGWVLAVAYSAFITRGLVQHQVAQPDNGKHVVIPLYLVAVPHYVRAALDHFTIDSDFAA